MLLSFLKASCYSAVVPWMEEAAVEPYIGISCSWCCTLLGGGGGSCCGALFDEQLLLLLCPTGRRAACSCCALLGTAATVVPYLGQVQLLVCLIEEK